MSKIMNTTSVALLALVGCAIGLGVTGCDQPVPKCTAGRGDWTVVYTKVESGPAECADTGLEVYGMQVYNTAKGDGTPDLEHANVAIQSATIGSVAQYVVDNGTEQDATDVEGQKWYAFGPFATPEPEGDFCRVPSMAPAKLDAPAVVFEDDPSTPDDESLYSQAAMNLQYDWSNVEFYVTPASLGTVMRGDVKVTIDSDGAAGPSAPVACEYSAIGVYYNVYCGTTIMQDAPDPDHPDDSTQTVSCAEDVGTCDKIGERCDADGNCALCWVPDDDPETDCYSIQASCMGLTCQIPVPCQEQSECEQYGAICNAYGECEKADQHLCSPYPDPDNGYPAGSGIDPAVPMKCDEPTMTCVPDGTPPQLQ